MSFCSMAGQIIMGIAYGIDVSPQDDPYVSLAETALQAVESASTTGWTFDMIPFCGCAPVQSKKFCSIECGRIDRHLPWWFPGASFKKEAARFAPHIDDMINKPYQTVKDALVRLPCPFQKCILYIDITTLGNRSRRAVNRSIHDSKPL